MADGELVARSTSLRQAGSDMHQVAQDLDAAWKAFQPDAKDLRYGTTDLVGSLIGASYEAVLEWAQTTYGSAVEAFSSFGDAIHTMADRYDDADASSTAAFEFVRKEL
jgi:uncharacterized protein YukE